MSDILTDCPVEELVERMERVSRGEEEPPEVTSLPKEMLERGYKNLCKQDVKRWIEEAQTMKNRP